MFEKRWYPKGHRLIEEGTLGVNFYILVHGEVAVMQKQKRLEKAVRTSRLQCERQEVEAVYDRLSQLSKLGGGTQEGKRRIVDRFEKRWYPNGHRLIEQGTISHEFFVLSKGEVNVLQQRKVHVLFVPALLHVNTSC